MSSFRFLAFFMMLCSAASQAGAQAALEPFKTTPAETSAAQRVFVYREQAITDGDRAQLVRLVVAATRVETWQLIKPLDTRAGLDRIIDDYYDYFSRGPYAAPLTVEALRRAIVDKNEGLRPENLPQEFRIPPFPFRGSGDIPEGRPILRVFNTQTHAYSLRQDPFRVEVAQDTTLPRVDASDEALRPYRNVSLTGILVPLSAELRSAIAAQQLPAGVLSLSGVAPQGGDGSVVDPGVAEIELLAVDRDPVCPFGSSIAGMSRYSTPLVDPARRQRMLDEARKMPLVIMDVGFGNPEDGHHGAVVRLVAQKTAEDLGFGFLLTDDTFKAFDLFPTDASSKKGLHDLITDYVDSGPERFKKGLLSPYIDQATLWVNHADQLLALGPPKLNVPDLLLRAALWRAISKNWWLNLSFRAKASVIDALPKANLEASGSFVVSAVGNDAGPMRSGYVPQDAAHTYKSFVTVTFGTPDGKVKGEHSHLDTTTPTRVFVLGRGCFEGIDREGSSLAAPVVAVAAWIRRLLDLSSAAPAPPLARLRQEVMRAARPIPALNARVESMGFFDARRLLETRTPHLAAPDGTITPLTDFMLTADCADREKGVDIDSTELDNAVEATILAVGDGDEPFLWRGRIALLTSMNEGSDGRNVCRVKKLTFSANGGRIAFTTVREFQAGVHYIDW